MPTTPTYPGVYIEEVPSSVRTIVGVSTSVAAFIGFFERGPRDAAVRVFNMGDFQREFGGLNRLSEASYGIQQFFRNGGSEVWVVRVASGSPVAASVVLRDSPASGSERVMRVKAGRWIRGRSVDNPGKWGDRLQLEVDYDVDSSRYDPREFFNLTVSEVAARTGSLTVVRTETFANLTLRPRHARNALAVVNEGSKLVQLDQLGVTVPDPFTTGFRPAATGTLGSALAPATPATIPSDGSTFNVDPASGNLLCTLSYGGATVSDYAELRPYIQAAIRAAAPTEPALAGAQVELVATGATAAPYSFRVLAGRTGAGFDSETVLAFSDNGADTTATDLGLPTGGANVQLYSLGTGSAGAQSSATRGDDGSVPTAQALRGVEADKTGLYALEEVDLFNILCIPRAADLSQQSDTQAVYSAAESYCEKRRAILIVDIPASKATVDQMLTWANQNATLRHANAAVYFPRLRVPDPLNDFRLKDLAASGTLAGVYARTDGSRGVWKAPAGIDATLRGVSELAYLLTDQQNGALNPQGVNCLRTFKEYGNVCWGGRTLFGNDARASEWKYLPVRRIALYIEESLYRGTQWVVFEPNDEPLWAQIRLNVGAYMHGLFRQGAFQGSSPREAYLVKCDDETTIQDDIDRGIVNILVGFAPLKPAEFVIIKIQQLAGQTRE